MKELAGPGGKRFRRGLDDEVFVLVIDPLVGDDGTQRFLGRTFRW
jgi:hypothetical protein